MCFARSVKVRNKIKEKRKPINIHFTFYQGIICNSFRVNKLFKNVREVLFKGTFSCLTQFLANVSSLKMIKNAFYFYLKNIFVLTF